MIWSAGALDDVEGIGAYIGQFDSGPAVRMQQRLRAAGDSLDEQPLRGRRVRGPLHALAHVRPYLIHYLVRGEIVLILTVRHGARRPL